MLGNYVYRFLNKKEVIYVGRTINMESRMSQHRRESNFYGKVDKIEFTELNNNSDMKITELILINVYNPKYNIKDKIGKTVYSEPELEWKEFKPKRYNKVSVKDYILTEEEKDRMERRRKYDLPLNYPDIPEDFQKKVSQYFNVEIGKYWWEMVHINTGKREFEVSYKNGVRKEEHDTFFLLNYKPTRDGFRLSTSYFEPTHTIKTIEELEYVLGRLHLTNPSVVNSNRVLKVDLTGLEM